MAGRELNDSLLHHVLELIPSNAEVVGWQPASLSVDWWASGPDMMCDCVANWAGQSTWLGHRGEFSQYGVIRDRLGDAI